MVGSGIQVPGEDASDGAKSAFVTNILEKAPELMLKPDFDDAEQSADFFRTLGLPSDATGYETAKYENKSFDETRENALREIAFGANLTSSQFKAISEGMLKYDHGVLIAAEGETSEAMVTLRDEWGQTFDERKGLANKVRENFLGFIPEGQMDARTLKALHKIGVQMGKEGTSLGDNRHEHNDSGTMTPAQAKIKIDEIMNNREHPYWVGGHPQHGDALKKMIELRTAADPSASTTLQRAGFGS